MIVTYQNWTSTPAKKLSRILMIGEVIDLRPPDPWSGSPKRLLIEHNAELLEHKIDGGRPGAYFFRNSEP